MCFLFFHPSYCSELARLKAQKLAYVYFEEEPDGGSAKLLSKDEARRIAADMAKLQELLRRRAEKGRSLPTTSRRAPSVKRWRTSGSDWQKIKAHSGANKEKV